MFKKALASGRMAARIYKREDNQYKQSMIKDILNMYADEVYKAVMDGERVMIPKVGTIIPQVKTHIHHYLPACKNLEDGLPYTKLKMTHNYALKEKMDRTLLDNIENGIYGLKKLSFDIQQMNILKRGGFIPEDAVVMGDDTIENDEDE